MERIRTEILPGVWLTALRTDKFKTAWLSVNLLTQLRRETAACTAVLPYVLRRGSTRLPDLETIAAELESLYGGCVTSKLFLNVREKLSLCYYVGSRLSTHKGLLTVTSGIDVKNYERALAEITAQLDAVRTGDFTDGELQAAIRSVASDLRATADAPDALAWYWLNRTVQGLDIDPAEMAALVEEVTRTDVTDIAAGVVCDCVYLLKGTEETADDE